jgi:hypothetical protein
LPLFFLSGAVPNNCSFPAGRLYSWNNCLTQVAGQLTAVGRRTIVSPCDSWKVSTTPILPRTIVHFWTNSRLTSPILQLPNNCTVQQPRLRPDPAPDPEQFNPITTRIQEKARTIPRAFAYHV